MDRLRPRDKQLDSGFSEYETEKMERLLKESVEQLLDPENCRKLSRNFNRSSTRAGKPIIKWTEVQSWFQSRLQDCQSKLLPESDPSEKAHTGSQMPKGENVLDLSDLEFEAKSSRDGAWYDVETFLTHRFLNSGEAVTTTHLDTLLVTRLVKPRVYEVIKEVRIRFVGFGAEEDEWVNVKNAVRLRSVPIENSECHTVKVGDTVLCLQERRDQAIYYDARVIDIQRKMHDVRGCRCIFLVQYEHEDRTEARKSPVEEIVYYFECLMPKRSR